ILPQSRCYWRAFYATAPALTTRLAQGRSSGDVAQLRCAAEFGEALGEALALRVGECGRAGTGDGVRSARGGNLPIERGPDYLIHDDVVIGAAARMRVAIALNQPRAFGNFERQCWRHFGRLGDCREP